MTNYIKNSCGAPEKTEEQLISAMLPQPSGNTWALQGKNQDMCFVQVIRAAFGEKWAGEQALCYCLRSYSKRDVGGKEIHGRNISAQSNIYLGA